MPWESRHQGSSATTGILWSHKHEQTNKQTNKQNNQGKYQAPCWTSGIEKISGPLLDLRPTREKYQTLYCRAVKLANFFNFGPMWLSNPGQVTLSWSQSISRGSGFAIYSGVGCHHQGWHSGMSSHQNSTYEIVAMRSSIWWCSHISIIVSFDMRTAELLCTCIASAN